MRALRLPTKIDRRSICLLIVFLSFLPLQSGSFSANFFYLFLFLACPIAAVDKVPAYAALSIAIPSMALLVGFLSGIGADLDLLRSFVSYGAYVSILAIILLRVPLSPDGIYKALIAVCVGYSALCVYFVLSEAQFELADIRGIKSGMRDFLPHWPQRFPILVVVALLYLTFKPDFHFRDLVPIAVLLACVVFTYTRAVYLALFVGVALGLLPKFRRVTLRTIRFGIYYSLSILGAVGLALFFDYEPALLLYDGVVRISSEAYNSLYQFFSGDIAVDRSGGSESERLYHWVQALAIWQERPLFGTGFSGIYQFSDMGSAHSQYIDTLLRIGVFGLVVYLYLWLLLFFRFWKRPEIFSGLAAIFVFGFFHETTKLTYTGLLFVLLLSYLKESSPLHAREPL